MAVQIAQHPCFINYVQEGKDIVNRHRAGKEPGPGGGPAEDAEEESEEEQVFELDLDALDAAMQTLQRAKAETSEDNTGHFKVVPLGGKWTVQHKEVPMDAWQGKPVNAVALNFCQLYQFGTSGAQRFDVSLYGNEGALILARYFVSKMTFFFKHWADAGASESYVFPADIQVDWQEPEKFCAFALEASNPKIVQRVEALRGLVPVLMDLY